MSDDFLTAAGSRVVSIIVRYKCPTLDAFIATGARDLAPDGVFVRSASPFPIGTLIHFELRLSTDAPFVVGLGRVVWRREATGSDPCGMGISFLRIEEASRPLLDRIQREVPDAGGAYRVTPSSDAASGLDRFPDEEPPSTITAAHSSALPPRRRGPLDSEPDTTEVRSAPPVPAPHRAPGHREASSTDGRWEIDFDDDPASTTIVLSTPSLQNTSAPRQAIVQPVTGILEPRLANPVTPAARTSTSMMAAPAVHRPSLQIGPPSGPHRARTATNPLMTPLAPPSEAVNTAPESSRPFAALHPDDRRRLRVVTTLLVIVALLLLVIVLGVVGLGWLLFGDGRLRLLLRG
jgi:hypothetical protein